jgi:hypothetical protein
MRWFAAVLVVLLLVALDRALSGGQGAEILLSLLRRGAATINQYAADFTRIVHR